MISFFSPPKYMGWFGKLPAVGDFAGRGIPRPMQETVYQWVSGGMALFVQSQPENWREIYETSPIWHFVINATVWDKSALIGCLAPSVDKVGRRSPLIVLRTFNKRDIAKVLPPESRWLYRVEATLRRIINERIAVDDVLDLLKQQRSDAFGLKKGSSAGILNELGIADNASNPAANRWFSWLNLPFLFAERSDRSFWWAEPAPGEPLVQIIHDTPPDADLFFQLMMAGTPK
jgi:type VI secretion system protein ImpM